MKSICALVHRPDLDRAAFQDYYERNHAPLAISHFAFRRYVRNHLLDAPDLGYDTISEFWADDLPAVAGLMDGPIGEIMRTDEDRFMDRARTAPAGSDEHVLSTGAPTTGDGTRFAALIDWDESDAGGASRAIAWARQCAETRQGVSIDITSSWREPPFPARAVVWMPQRCTIEPPDRTSIRMVHVRCIETPPTELRG